MIADMMDRRITRGLSNELQKRTDAQSQSQSQLQTQASILNDQSGSRTDISVTEAEAYGKDFSMFSRNSSEEILLKSLMEGSMSIAAPSLEAMGFKSLPPANRGDSEELFNSWLLNAENHGYSSTHIAHRTRQASRRISSELVALLAQQTGSVFQKTNSFEHLFQGNSYPVNEMCNDSNQFKLRNGGEKGASASDLFLSKTWLQSSQPMTRSRSSELRRRYAAMQGMLAPAGVEASQGPVGRGICNAKLETMSLGSFSHNLAVEQSNQQPAFLSPSLSSMVPFNMQAQQAVDSVSSVVSMLKGTLERKKLGTNHFNNVVSTDNPFSLYGNQEAFYGIAPNSNSFLQIPEPLEALQTVQLMKMKDEEQLLTVAQSPREKEMDCSDAQPNQMQASTMSQEPSQSESSAAAPGLSTGVTICEDPVNSGQTLSRCESSMKWVADGDLEQNSKDKGFCESQFEGFFKTSSKKANHLTRMGSVTSSGRSVDKEDLTKKRRVERQRKMAEAKGRNHIPVMPSDVQAVLKRCEALEKEVRSLKLNLSFMNRKDSEQTKQIEELQKHNEDLLEEKEQLLEEIERFTSEKGGI